MSSKNMAQIPAGGGQFDLTAFGGYRIRKESPDGPGIL
jgi:hypothetical protein